MKRIGSNSSNTLTAAVKFTSFDNTHLVAFGNSYNDTLSGAPTGQEAWSSWIAKMDTSGNFSSLKVLAGLNISISGMQADKLHHLYLSGTYSGGAFNNSSFHLDTLYQQGSREAFLVKFDSNLNFLWSRMTYSAHRDARGAGSTGGDGLAIDTENNVYLIPNRIPCSSTQRMFIRFRVTITSLHPGEII